MRYLPLSTFLKYGSKLIVKGRNILKSATNKSCLCNCKNASSFLSSLSNSSNGAASRKHANFTRTLKFNQIKTFTKTFHLFNILFINRLQ